MMVAPTMVLVVAAMVVKGPRLEAVAIHATRPRSDLLSALSKCPRGSDRCPGSRKHISGTSAAHQRLVFYEESGVATGAVGVSFI